MPRRVRARDNTVARAHVHAVVWELLVHARESREKGRVRAGGRVSRAEVSRAEGLNAGSPVFRFSGSLIVDRRDPAPIV